MDIIDRIIKREGGFVNLKNDRGGPTKYGITQDTLSNARGRQVSIDDVRHLSEQEAREIYEKNYIHKPGFHQIADKCLLELVVDAGVNSGPYNAAKWLQEAAGVKIDGVVGPITLKAINTGNPILIRKKFMGARMRFVGRIIKKDNTQAEFAEGWMDRLADLIEEYV